MNTERYAALLLIDLQPRDRDDILDRLPAAIRERVQPALDELQRMGVTHGEDWLRDVVTEMPRNDAQSVAVATVDAAAPAAIATLMAGEPGCIAATLLASHDWSWSADYLKSLNADQRQMLGKRVAAGNQTGRQSLANALIRRVAERLQARADDDTAGRFEAALAAHSGPGDRQWRPSWAR